MRLQYDPSPFQAQYREADPFPYIVLDGLFDDADLERVLAEFPSPEAMKWMRFDNPQEKKLGFFYATSTISDVVRRFLDAMNSFEKPDVVSVTAREHQGFGSHFSYEFPAHSISLLQIVGA